MKRVMLYFGSFNPVHRGHIALAEYVVGQGLCDEAVLVVSPQSPYKQAAELAPEMDRFEMAEIACAASKYPEHIKPSVVEFLLPKPSYTIDTLRYLKENFGSGMQFSILMGSDQIARLAGWKEYEQILEYPVYVYPRRGEPAEGFEGRITRLTDAPLQDFASTDVRDRIGRGEDVAAMLKEDALIDLIANEDKIVKYLDIPIQHIDNDILRRMNRHCTGDEIRALLQKLRARIPGLVLRRSLITGLPGEGEAELEELCVFLRETKIERAGVFPFSPEEGTKAAAMEHVDADTAMARAQKVEMIQSEIMDEYNASVMGKTMEVLVDGYDEEFEQFYGRTFADSPEIDGRVWIAAQEPLHEGDFVQVTMDGTQDGDLTGYVAEEAEE